MLENEIARLRAENAALKKEILAHGLPLPPGATAGAAGERRRRQRRHAALADNADIDRMVAFVGRVWHRFVDAIDGRRSRS